MTNRSGPYSITALEPRGKCLSFTLITHTSQGMDYTRGWRITQDKPHRLIPPSYPCGPGRYMPIQKLSRNAHAIVRKLALAALARFERLQAQSVPVGASSESQSPLQSADSDYPSGSSQSAGQH